MKNLLNLLHRIFFKKEYALGSLSNPLDLRDIELATFQAPVTLPYEYITDISMIPVMDQKSYGTCVGQAEGTILAYYDYLENRNVSVSRRYIYAKAKERDGIPDLQGTYPRVAASVIEAKGSPEQVFVPDDNNLPYAEYLNISDGYKALTDSAKSRRANYAKVGLDLNSLKQAIYKNKLLSISLSVDWSAFPSSGKLTAPNPRNISGLHRVVLYGFKGNEFFGRNSWGESWGDNGNFSFQFLDYAPYVFDALVYTDIPNEILEDVKKQEYTFTQTLRIGMTGPEVLKLQKFLKLKEDGWFGKITQRAVMNFQQLNGLVADGVWGPKTIEKANKPAFMMTPLELAIMKVESGGDLYAIGDKTLKHKAYGCMQIRQGVCDDLNAALGMKIKSEQMLGNLNLSIFVFREWQKRWNLNGTDEEKAKSWNGGAGWKQRIGKPEYAEYNKKLDEYWKKVKANL